MTNADGLDALLNRVAELESRIAIRDLVSDYCHGFDKRDYDRFLSIWWEDCVWDIGPPFGRFEGHSGIHTAIHDVLWPAWRETHHLSTNLKIEFLDAAHDSQGLRQWDIHRGLQPGRKKSKRAWVSRAGRGYRAVGKPVGRKYH